MTTYHVYKTDCLGASRVMLQSDWEGRRSGFVHLCRPGRPAGPQPELPYGLKSILQLFRAASPQQQLCLVFHAQSSLPLLFAAYLLRWIYGVSQYVTFVYDIHDLHQHEPYRSTIERLRYGVLRYYPLRWLERWAVSRRSIRLMTVSDGLARTAARWYDCAAPIVVHSAMQPRRSAGELRAMKRRANALLFFGTAERLPFELIDNIGNAGLELHLYGRFDGRAGLEQKIGRSLPSHVKVFGEYSPADLDFLGEYNYLLIYKPDDLRENFIFSLPNKFFQSIGYGLSLILSPNFEEMEQVASVVPGGTISLHDSSELSGRMSDLEILRDDRYWSDIVQLGHTLHDEARNRYLSLTSVEAK